MNDILKLVFDGHEISYKQLSIGSFRFNGQQFIQVHCDRTDLQFSDMYPTTVARKAVAKYVELHGKYLSSERKHGDCPPFVAGGKFVPK